MTKKANDRRCETCRHDLGGGYNNCRINLEAECAAGGFEAWEPKEKETEAASIGNQWEYVSDNSLLEYVTQDGEKLFALDTNSPISDGFYSNPSNRYMGIGNRPATRSCGSCALVGYCQFCMQRWPTPR